jgi:hypothetical protein
MRTSDGICVFLLIMFLALSAITTFAYEYLLQIGLQLP